MTDMTETAAVLDLGIEEAESFDAPLSDAGDFVAGVAVGLLVGIGVALIFT